MALTLRTMRSRRTESSRRTMDDEEHRCKCPFCNAYVNAYISICDISITDNASQLFNSDASLFST